MILASSTLPPNLTRDGPFGGGGGGAAALEPPPKPPRVSPSPPEPPNTPAPPPAGSGGNSASLNTATSLGMEWGCTNLPWDNRRATGFTITFGAAAGGG